ncbi:HD-GYP domain-containing protein [Thiobacillus sedimenti]|uniref:HD-GYP domain-containing protein n=1 Tax=Thiobacillus sedimenti TaxID=3110231 RepID=A0ABZ1CK05_9PROT|nr:HD-GYP domain-containing protein [Thiobacillus sp. SCUT-2]WRS38607.1 HD-GYP domain-containing protein [Thiobacillus sp. SCUT-2]
MSEREQRISVDQLRVGLHIRIESWMDHPFLFSSFKIRSEKQVQQLRALGISHVLWDARRSDVPPLPPPAPGAPPPPPAEPDPEMEAMWAEKRARREKLARQREALGRCERQFAAGASAVKSLLRNFFAKPGESMQQAQGLVSDMVDAMLADKDVVLHLVNAKAGDENAYYHALNVTMLALILGKEAQLDAEAMRALGLGTLLHDIGREKIPSQILLNKAPWTKAELSFYQQHVAYGVDMARHLPGLPPAALEVIAMHHELLDGSGYPRGLAGDQIGRLARIAGITNAFDTYCNRPNPADSMTPAEAIAFMFKKEPAKYDPVLLQLFVRSMGVYPPGSVVQLSDGRIGLVMSVNPGRLLHPSLLIHDPDVPKEEALWLDLRESPEVSVAKTLRPAELDRAVLAYLDPRTRISYFTENGLAGNRGA